MKDKRLDILLEHFKQKQACQYHIFDRGQAFCLKIKEEGFPGRTDCEGHIKACELEEGQ